jgi:hypothetical protein
MMEYLKIWTSFAEILEPLNDSERGRLFTAMLEYAGEEKLPEFKGNERFVWPAAKQAIDRARAESDKQTANGSKGGRPKKSPTKPNETQQNPTKPNETQQNPKDNIKKNNIKKNNTADAVYTPAPAPEGIIPFGAELTDDEIAESLSRDRQIEDACKDWGLPCNPGSMIHARDLAREYSLEWLLEAIKRAGLGKSQTWAYVDGILRSFRANGGIDAPGSGKAAGKAVSAQQYGQRQYTEEELLSVSDDLLAEARKAREAAG